MDNNRKEHLKILNLGGLTLIEVHDSIIANQNNLYFLNRLYDMLTQQYEYYNSKLPYYNSLRTTKRKLKILTALADIDMLLDEARNYISFLIPACKEIGDE